MRIHYLQHEAFEDAGNIAVWARARGHEVSATRLDRDEPLPPLDSFDWLVVMGGTMNVYEHDKHPWLVAEKKFIRRAIEQEKLYLGVCLGAQLAADALGARVRRNAYKEIGWFPVTLTSEGVRSPLLSGFSRQFTAFHWHGDTFDLPVGAVHLAKSGACAHQAFQYGDRVLGIQFHLDYSVDGIHRMLDNCPAEVRKAGPAVQTAVQIQAGEGHVAATQRLLDRLLDNLAGMADPLPLGGDGGRVAAG